MALLTIALVLFGVSTAPAQTYNFVADSTDLAPSGGGTADAHCIVEASNGTLVFFNSAAGGIYAWDGSSLIEHTSPSTLNNNISGESNDIDRCDAVAIDDNGFVYFSFRSSNASPSVNYVYRTEVSDATNFVSEEIDGVNGLAVDGSTLYLASVAEFDDSGTRGDGVYEINSDLSNSPQEVATNSDINFEDAAFDVSSDGNVYGWSIGSGNFQDVIVSVNPSSTSPSFSTFLDPYGSGSPLNQGEIAGKAIGDLNIITFDGTEFMVVYNGVFDGPNGEEWATIRFSDQNIDLLFTRDDLVSKLSQVDGYTGGFTEPMAVNSSGTITIASRTGFGADDYLASVSGASPLPVEMASFDAVQRGSTVELTWQTASETNNAGFRVQRQTESGWTSLGFVDSKAAGGTTTEAQSYRYSVEQELKPGTHQFRLKQQDLDGTTHLSDVVSVDLQMTDALSLSGPAPNPVAQQATISFAVKEQTEATVSLYNTLGQKVATLYQGTPPAEQTKALTLRTQDLPSGVYLVRLQADGQTRTQRVTVVK